MYIESYVLKLLINKRTKQVLVVEKSELASLLAMENTIK
jgi:hypothetical protein